MATITHISHSVCCVKSYFIFHSSTNHYLLFQILCKDLRDTKTIHCLCTCHAFFLPQKKNKVGDYIIHLSNESCRRCNLKEMGPGDEEDGRFVCKTLQHRPDKSPLTVYKTTTIMILIPFIAFAILLWLTQ